jgi:hypothetical protein
MRRQTTPNRNEDAALTDVAAHRETAPTTFWLLAAMSALPPISAKNLES